MFTTALAHTLKFWQYIRTVIHSRYMLKLGNSFFIVMLLVSNVTGSVQAKPVQPENRSVDQAENQTDSMAFTATKLFSHSGKTTRSGILQQDATPTPTDCVQAPDDLIAYWPADGDGKDIIGGHNGSLINGTTYETGKIGQAFSFDGSNDYVDLGNWFTFQDFSVSMWVKAGDAQQTYADIIDNNHRTGVNWVVQQSVDQVNQYSWSGVVEFGLTEGQWQHLVINHDSQGGYTTYLDDVLVNSVQAGLINYNGTQFLRLGTWGGGGRNWKGLLDEVKVYNRALTSTEVSALFANTGTKLCSKQVDVTGSDVEITSPSFLQADGVQAAMITVTVKNTDGNPVSNSKVIFDVAGDETQLQYASETTDANGVISAQLTSTVPGVKSVKAGIVTPGGTLSLLKVPTVVFKGAEISGKVYQDKNGNGEFDPGEDGVVGIPVNLFDTQDTLIASTASDAGGHYLLDGLQAGSYQLVVEPGNSYDIAMANQTINLNAFETESGHDFGLSGMATVLGKVWDDVNQNQTIDENEMKLVGASVSGFTADNPGKTTQTGQNGEYLLKLPAPAPAGPANFNFDSSSYAIEQGLTGQIYNPDFEKPIKVFGAEVFPENYNFEQSGYLLDATTYPDNHDFETPGYNLNPNTFPANYDFELGNLGAWQSDAFYVVSGSQDGSYAAYSPEGNAGTLISPTFTIPTDAQTLTWDWRISYAGDWWRRGASFYLVDAETGQDLVTMYNNVGTSDTWQKYSFNVSDYRGRAVRFKTTKLDSRNNFYLDNVRMAVNLPAWAISAGMNGSLATTIVSGTNENTSQVIYSPYNTDMTIISPDFTIPADAQTLTWDWRISYAGDWWRSGASFYLVDAETSQDLVTMYNNVGTSDTWQKYNFNVSDYRGQAVRFKASKLDARNDFYLDNIQLGVNVPTWSFSAGMNGSLSTKVVVGTEEHPSQVVYSPYDTGLTLVSSAFTIPVDAQTLTWDWRISFARDWWRRGASFYLVDAETGQDLVQMYNNVGTSDTWQKYSFNVSDYRGKAVLFKAVKLDARNDFYLDQVRLEINTLGWGLSAGMNGNLATKIVPGDNNHASQVIYSPYATDMTIVSPAFTIPAEAQILAWDWRISFAGDWWRRGASFYLVDAETGQNLVTLYNNAGTSDTWRTYSYNISDYRGKRVQFKATKLDNRNDFYLDNVRLEVVAPGWNLSGGMNGDIATGVSTVSGYFDAPALYSPYWTDVSITSPAFTIPADAHTLIWDWRISYAGDWWRRGASFYLVDAETGQDLATMYSNVGTSDVWQELSYDVTAYRNRPVQFKVIKLHAQNDLYLDNVFITPNSTTAYTIVEENLPGYKSSTPDTVAQTLYGGQQVNLNFGDFTIDLGQSTLTVDPTTLAANGIDTAEVTVTIKDGLGNPMPEREVQVETSGRNVTVDQPVLTTDTQGQVTATISSTVAQTVSVKARDVAENVILTDVKQVTFTPGPVDASRSTITVTPGYVSANGSMTAAITVTLKDAHDNPVAGHEVEITQDGENVTLEIPAPISNEQGQVTATIHASSPQLVTIQAWDVTTETQLASNGTVTFVATDPAQSTISVSPASISADSVDGVEVTIILKDSAGLPVANAPVDLQISGTDNLLDGQPIGAAPVTIGNTDANGSIAVHLASTQAETKTITVTGQHVQLDQIVEVVVSPGAASGSVSVLASEPVQVVADGQQAAAVTLTLKDAQGNLIPNHEIGVIASGLNVQIELPQPARTDENGKLIAKITSTELGEATILVQDVTDQVTIGQPIMVEFIAGPADPANSSLEVVAENLVANGADSATVTVILKDSIGHVLAGHEVQLAVSGSGNAIDGPTIAITDDNGVITFTVSSTRAEQKTITVVDRTNNVTLNEKPVLTFVPGPLSLQNSRIETSATEVGADGETSAIITVTALDAFNNPLQNLGVSLLASGSAVITQPTNPTDANGRATGQVTNAHLETVTVSARVNGVLLPGTIQVTFKGADLAASLTGTSEAAPEGSIRYSLLVKNTGNLTAENVGLTLALPTELSLVGHTASGEPEQQGSSLIWNLGSLPSGGQISYEVVVQVAAEAVVGTSLNTTLTTTTSTLEAKTGNNQASAATTIVPAYNFSVSLTPSNASLSLGGSTSYILHVANTGQKADTFTFSVTGLNSDWVTFTPDSVSLAAGAVVEAGVTVSITACTSQQTESFGVTVTSTGTGQTQSASASLTVLTAPEISVNAPGENSLSGSTSVLLSWRTSPETTGVLEIYPAGNPEQAQTFSTSEGALHSVQVDNLTRNQTYEWKVIATSPCGSNTLTRHFAVGNGIVFGNHAQSFTIDRDYDQRVQVSVRNEDALPHTLTTSVLNPYKDLIANFVESGSVDQTITLQPGETRQVTLTIHAQDAELRNYQLTARLVADQESANPITDNAVLNLTILAEGDYTIVEDLAAFDPLTLGKTYVITNHGKVITDLSLKATDPETGLPAEVLIQPSLDHVRLETGQSMRVVVYPIFGAEDVAQPISATTSGNGLQLFAYSSSLNASTSQSQPADKYFTLDGEGAGHTVSVPGSISCPMGKQVYPVQLVNVTCSFASSDWYCTNRPRIVTPIQIPAFFNQASLSSAFLGLQFTPHGGVLPHNGTVSINGAQIGAFNNSIPYGFYQFPISSANLTSSVAGMATQNIQLDTAHNNSGHYVSSSNYVLGLNVAQATTYACAASATEAQQSVMVTYSCSGTTGFNPWTDIFNGSTFNWGEIKKLIKDIAAAFHYEISTVSCTQGDCGDPINTRTGVFSFASPDLSFPTSAGDLVFQRAYSSGTTEAYAGSLGYGWTHNHDVRLIFPSDPGGMADFVIFKDLLGNQYLFGIQADGSYKPGPGVLATMVKSEATYILTTPEQVEFTFDESGKILFQSDAQGHSFDYTYAQDGNLTRISTDQGTRYLDLAYDDQGRIVSVTDYTGRQVTYTYDAAGDLVSSTDLLGRTWSYAYDSAHHMTQVLDPTGQETVTTEYDMNGRAYRQFDGEGNLMVRIVYNADGSTTVYDAKGNAQTHTSNEHNVVTEKRDELNRATDTTYDENFRPTTITNAAGHTLEMEWSADGRNLLSKTDPAGHTTSYTYDSLNNLTSLCTDGSETHPNCTTYTYDGRLLTGKTGPDGKTTTYTYTAEGWLETETDAYGRETAYTYDAHGQKTSVTDWRGRTTTYIYDDLGRLVETIDPRGRISRSEYDQAGQLLRSTSNYDPNRPQNDGNQYNIVTMYEYDLRGNQVAVTDSLGRVTRYEYDDADRLVRTIDAAGNLTTNTYDANGRLESTTDALGNLTTYVYDAVGRRLSTIDALGHSSGTTTFNIPANTSTAIDALGRSATYHYDELNRVVKVVDPLGNQTTTTYDAGGNVATRTDQLGRITRYEYDSLGRLVRTIDPPSTGQGPGGITQTVYDANGNRIATIDPLGNQTSYTYDDQGRLLTTTDALGNTTSNEYDQDGNLVATTDALGRITHTEYDPWGRRIATTDIAGRRTTYTYDALDRVVSVTGPTGTTTTTYDALGNVTAQSDEHGRVSTSAYDELGRVISTTDFDGNTTTSQYDAVGNLVATTDGLGNTTTYTYDALNRRVTTTDALGNTSSVVYDRLGNITHETNANGVVTYYLYDELNRKAAVIHNYRPTMQADAETNVRVEYTYNAVGNRTHVRDANGNVTEFRYNALNRVTHKIDPLDNTWVYEYDLAGNLVSRTDGNGNTTTFTYNALHQLTLINYPSTGSGQVPEPDADVSFTYNALGQRISMQDGLGTTTWNYDSLNRLESVTGPYGNTVSYTYDEQGNRTGLQYPDGKQAAYNYDQDNRLAEVASWDSNVTEYEYDSLGRLLSLLRPNGVASAYAYDQAGRLALLEHTIDAGMLAKYEYTYDAVGNIIQAREHTSGATAIMPTVLVIVIDAGGAPLAGQTVYAVNDADDEIHNEVTDEQGQATFDLPPGVYRFRTEIDGIQFSSGAEAHCWVGQCEQAIITIPQPVLVTVTDTDQLAQAGVSVSAYSGTTSAGVGGTTDENGQVQLRLPTGEYRFQADFNGTSFWSGTENHCPVPGCTMAQVVVNPPVTVTVFDSVWNTVPGQTVYAWQNSTYSGYSAISDENGEARFTLPDGDYRFQTEFGGEVFWSEADEVCPLPGCSAATLRVALPITIKVVDFKGRSAFGVTVEAFNGEVATGHSGVTDKDGTVAFTLPAGSYRFRATHFLGEYWSGTENHCEIFVCSGAVITLSQGGSFPPGPILTPRPPGIPLPTPPVELQETSEPQLDKSEAHSAGKSLLFGEGDVTIVVLDADGDPREGVPLLAFDGDMPTEYGGVTDSNGQLTLALPDGDYRFRADYNGTQFWSAPENHCSVPNCLNVDVRVTVPVTVTVRDTDGAPKAGLKVYAFDGTTYKNFNATTDEQGQVTFTLPQGEYRFRSDFNGAQFWSSDQNHCAIPDCASAAITVTKPITITVAGQGGQPYPGLKVYAFTGSTYTGYHGASDENGQLTLTLPLGEYRFRADYDGVQFWSGQENHCAIPGCEAANVTLPGGTGESVVTIDYEYDALRRLTSAVYSNGISFHYAYDAAGNVLEYTAALSGQSSVTSYQYDSANQLTSATQGSTVWHYVYDGNGSLIQTTPGESVANGAKRYTYNTAGYLTQVETYANAWQTQAEMLYDGLGNRLQMTAAGVTTQYELDNGRVLTANADGNATYYLYGLGLIAEQTDVWAYSLPDGSNTPRQLVNAAGEITYAASYTPWGDTLETYGSGRFTQGYFGGLMDAATGLIYVGNGQYYDPQTGRFLTRDARPSQNNPYIPVDPTGALLGPLALLALAFGKKRNRGKWDTLIILLVLVLQLDKDVG